MRSLATVLGLVLVLTAPAAARSSAKADSLGVLRKAYYARGWNDESLPGLAERIVAQRLASRAQPESVAVAYEWLGRVRLLRVENRAADSAFALAEAAQRGSRRQDPRAIARIVAWRAEGLRALRQLARAESTATLALELLERGNVSDPAVQMRARLARGNVLAERGRGEESVAELRRAVALGEALQPPDSLLLGHAVRSLARALTSAGDPHAGVNTFERAMTIQERALGEHPELGTTCYLAAMVASDIGDHVKARRYAERAVAIRERFYGPNHLVVGVALSAVGAALRNLGDVQSSLAQYERGVAILRAQTVPSPFELQVALNNLGGARLGIGDGAGARACYEEARDVRVRAFGPRAAHSAWSSTRLAHALMLTGDFEAAAQRVDSAFAAFDPARAAAQRPQICDALRIRGQIAWRLGRREAALADFERAFASEDSALGIRSTWTLEALAWTAAARAGLGDAAGAWAAAVRLERESREVLRLSARSLSESEALSYSRMLDSGLGLMLAFADSATVAPSEARIQLADAVVRARLLVLDQLAEERRSLPRFDPALAEVVGDLESARDTLARVLVDALRRGQATDARVDAARARRDAAERALAGKSRQFALELHRSSAGFAEIAAGLPAGSALVSIVRREDPGLSLRETWPTDSSQRASRRYAALVTRAGERVPRHVDLGPGTPIEAAIARWLDACATPPPAGRALAAAAERRCNALGRRVRELVWTPLERAIGPATRVFVVPDGALHAVNLLALPDPRGGVLAERGPTVHRLTAERDLLPWAAPPAAGLLAMGGVDFETPGHEDDRSPAAPGEPLAFRAREADSMRVHFTPLPRTADEVGEVAALWRASRVADAAEVRTPTGAEASEAAFKRLAPGRRVLHVATHGFALGGEVGAGLAGTRAMGVTADGASTANELPRAALLPGLALAGANAGASSGRDDGYLTAEEITSLDLGGNEWAVLSACETGLADPAAIEPVQGLPRAFRRAGTRTVIVSLWAVDDESTRAWMARLYRARLDDGLDTAESVRAACREVLRERRAKGLGTHPFHWAAFVASGDWH